jgi:hypothetical protein
MTAPGVPPNRGGRPRRAVDLKLIQFLRDESKLSWPKIARLTGLGQGTVVRAYDGALRGSQPFQNPKAAPSDLPQGTPNGV